MSTVFDFGDSLHDNFEDGLEFDENASDNDFLSLRLSAMVLDSIYVVDDVLLTFGHDGMDLDG